MGDASTTAGPAGTGASGGRHAGAPPGGAHCLHRALVYEDDAHYVRAVGRFVREGVRDGERVLVAAPAGRLAVVAEDLGADARSVDLLDTAAAERRSGDVFALLGAYAAAGRSRVVAETATADRRPDELREILRHEAALNVVLADADVAVLCPYDGRVVGEAVADALHRTHPEVVRDGHVVRGRGFRNPREFVESAVAGEPPPDGPVLELRSVRDVAGARRAVRAVAAAAGVAPSAVDDLGVAAGEVAANAVVHGGGDARLWCGVRDGVVVCTVRDAGRGPQDPLAGYLPPGGGAAEGRGLWLARRLCDSVEVAAGPAGTEVTLRRAAAPPR
jgi:anti-sigma regulatory factor (Ser/Thr protein kinase)